MVGESDFSFLDGKSVDEYIEDLERRYNSNNLDENENISESTFGGERKLPKGIALRKISDDTLQIGSDPDFRFEIDGLNEQQINYVYYLADLTEDDKFDTAQISSSDRSKVIGKLDKVGLLNIPKYPLATKILGFNKLDDMAVEICKILTLDGLPLITFESDDNLSQKNKVALQNYFDSNQIITTVECKSMSNPDLVIRTYNFEYPDIELDKVHNSSVPVLPVLLREKSALIGPFIKASDSPCLKCLNKLFTPKAMKENPISGNYYYASPPRPVGIYQATTGIVASLVKSYLLGDIDEVNEDVGSMISIFSPDFYVSYIKAEKTADCDCNVFNQFNFGGQFDNDDFDKISF